ncbi:hypothetical protein BJ912DRAFT_1067286 [Pholiota molesta]|nr:hypothetical protein BJ912DRAFT_1067286 [Pholiota molesta]
MDPNDLGWIYVTITRSTMLRITAKAISSHLLLDVSPLSNPCEMTDALVERFNLKAPNVVREEDLNTWVELYWRTGVDDVALPSLILFTEMGLAPMFPGPAARIMELLQMRSESSDMTVSPRGDRIRDPGMSINPPTVTPQSLKSLDRQ